MLSKSFFLLILGILFIGCSSAGIYQLSEECPKLPDGTRVCGIAGKTPGHSGADITFAQTYRCPLNGPCEKNADYAASAPGLVESASTGAVPAAFLAGGQIGGAALLRPTRINETTNVSGVSSSNQEQGQGQQQQQKQKGGDAAATASPSVSSTVSPTINPTISPTISPSASASTGPISNVAVGAGGQGGQGGQGGFGYGAGGQGGSATAIGTGGGGGNAFSNSFSNSNSSAKGGDAKAYGGSSNVGVGIGIGIDNKNVNVNDNYNKNQTTVTQPPQHKKCGWC